MSRRLAAVVATTTGAAVLFAATAAVADPEIMPDQYQQFTTDDGWVVDLTLTNELIDHIDNIAGASNSWQARVSYRAEVTISGAGSSPIQDSQVETGYFVGCRTDSSAGVEVGGDAGVGGFQAVGGGVGADLGVGVGAGVGGGVGGGAGGFLGLPTGVGAGVGGGVGGGVGAGVNAGVNAQVGAVAGVEEHLGGHIRVLLRPGGLAQLPIDRINLRNMHAVSQVRTVNIEADGCGGQVRIQSFATVRVRTDNGNDTQTLYGEPKTL